MIETVLPLATMLLSDKTGHIAHLASTARPCFGTTLSLTISTTFCALGVSVSIQSKIASSVMSFVSPAHIAMHPTMISLICVLHIFSRTCRVRSRILPVIACPAEAAGVPGVVTDHETSKASMTFPSHSADSTTDWHKHHPGGSVVTRLVIRRVRDKNARNQSQNATTAVIANPPFVTPSIRRNRPRQSDESLKSRQEHVHLRVAHTSARSRATVELLSHLQHRRLRLQTETIAKRMQDAWPSLQRRRNHEDKVHPVLQDTLVCTRRNSIDDDMSERLLERVRVVLGSAAYGGVSAVTLVRM